jgi:hypothetical protein
MRTVLAYLLLLATIGGNAQTDSALIRAPKWTARAQVAGMQGLVSGGALWNVPDGRLQMGAQYGFAPAANGSKAYHGLVLRATGSWFPIHKPQFGKWNLSPIASLSAVLEVGGIAFLALPPDYPKGYYAPQAIHGLLGLGGRLGQVGQDGGWSFTAEAVALDTYLWYGIIQQQIEVRNMWNLALGAEYHF